MLLGAAGGEHHDPARPGEQPDERLLLGDCHPADPLDPLGPPARDRVGDDVPAPRSLLDVRRVDVAAREEQVQHPQGQRQVTPRHRLHQHVGVRRGGGAARVDHHDAAAPLTQPVEVARRGRHGLGEVGADQDHDVGLLDVGEREGQSPVDAERAGGGRGGRAHAPPPVVVDLAGTDRDPGELAELVGLLVGQPAAAEDPDRVGAVLLTQAGQPLGDQVERLVPGRRPQLAGAAVAQQRRGQPIATAAKATGRPALAAQRPLVDRELRPGLHLEIPATTARAGQGHAALEGAVRAVRPGLLRGRRAGHQARACASGAVRRM